MYIYSNNKNAFKCVQSVTEYIQVASTKTIPVFRSYVTNAGVGSL